MQLQPLAAAELSPAVARLVGGATPAKLMAVRGMAPVRPAELLVAIYQLSFDAEPAVRTAAEAAPASFPDNVINPPLGEALPAPLLHFFAARLPDQRTAALERILYNPATADETFVMLAGRLDESLLEIVSQNEVRLLRCPAIVERKTKCAFCAARPSWRLCFSTSGRACRRSTGRWNCARATACDWMASRRLTKS
jgi:hypothetical protein